MRLLLAGGMGTVQRADVILYLNAQGSNLPLPAAEAAAAAPAADASAPAADASAEASEAAK